MATNRELSCKEVSIATSLCEAPKNCRSISMEMRSLAIPEVISKIGLNINLCSQLLTEMQQKCVTNVGYLSGIIERDVAEDVSLRHAGQTGSEIRRSIREEHRIGSLTTSATVGRRDRVGVLFLDRF